MNNSFQTYAIAALEAKGYKATPIGNLVKIGKNRIYTTDGMKKFLAAAN